MSYINVKRVFLKPLRSHWLFLSIYFRRIKILSRILIGFKNTALKILLSCWRMTFLIKILREMIPPKFENSSLEYIRYEYCWRLVILKSTWKLLESVARTSLKKCMTMTKFDRVENVNWLNDANFKLFNSKYLSMFRNS